MVAFWVKAAGDNLNSVKMKCTKTKVSTHKRKERDKSTFKCEKSTPSASGKPTRSC